MPFDSDYSGEVGAVTLFLLPGEQMIMPGISRMVLCL